MACFNLQVLNFVFHPGRPTAAVCRSKKKKMKTAKKKKEEKKEEDEGEEEEVLIKEKKTIETAKKHFTRSSS